MSTRDPSPPPFTPFVPEEPLGLFLNPEAAAGADAAALTALGNEIRQRHIRPLAMGTMIVAAGRAPPGRPGTTPPNGFGAAGGRAPDGRPVRPAGSGW